MCGIISWLDVDTRAFLRVNRRGRKRGEGGRECAAPSLPVPRVQQLEGVER
jgi:hypothetical protein